MEEKQIGRNCPRLAARRRPRPLISIRPHDQPRSTGSPRFSKHSPLATHPEVFIYRRDDPRVQPPLASVIPGENPGQVCPPQQVLLVLQIESVTCDYLSVLSVSYPLLMLPVWLLIDLWKGNPPSAVSVISLLYFHYPQNLFFLHPSPPTHSRLPPPATMYPRLESYPVTTTHPPGPKRQVLHYPLTKSAVFSSQVSTQLAFHRPTLSIPSRSSSNSSASGSSPEFSTEDVNRYPISTPKPSTMPSQQQPSSNRALLQGRPLPQVPPLPMPPAPAQPLANASLNTMNPSPITSPSSPTTLHRPKRALPIIPPSPRTSQMTCPPYLSTSPATSSICSSDVCVQSPQSSSSAEPSLRLHSKPSLDLSPTTAVIHRIPPPMQHSQTRIALRRVNAEASSSKVQLPPRSPVSLEELVLPLPPLRPKLKVQTSPVTRTLAGHPHRESVSSNRPSLRIQAGSLAEPNSASLVRTRHQFPQQVHPLPRVPIQTEPNRVSDLPRRSSLDSLTTRSSALLSPGQALSPFVSKRPRSRRFSKSPQQYGFSNELPIPEVAPAPTTGHDDRGLVEEDEAEEQISPIKFTRDDPDVEHDEDPNFGWDEASPRRGGRSAVESRAYFLATTLFRLN